MTISELLEEYLQYQLDMGRFVSNTASAVRSDFRGFFRFLKNRNEQPTLHAFSVRNLSAYFAANRKRVEGSTAKRWRKSLNGFAEWAVARDYLSKNPIDAVELPWSPVNRREFLFGDHSAPRSFLTTPAATKLLPEVDHALRSLLLFGGLRSSEVRKLEWQHVDFEKSELKIYDSKFTRRKGLPDNLDRIVPMSRPLHDALTALKRVVPSAPDSPVVVSRRLRPLSKDAYYEAFHAICAAAGLDESMVPHCLRHNLAGTLLACGAFYPDVALVLGHRTAGDGTQRPTVTDGYITGSMQRLRTSLERYASLVLSAGVEGAVTTPATEMMGPSSEFPPQSPHSASVQDIAHSSSSGEIARRVADAAELWRTLVPNSGLADPEFLRFLRAVLSPQ